MEKSQTVGEHSAQRAVSRRLPAAAAERLERVKLAAERTPALRYVAVQHRRAIDVRSAQAELHMVGFDERLGAARHAAHARAVAWALAAHCSVVPLLKHWQRVAATRRHATCMPACK